MQAIKNLFIRIKNDPDKYLLMALIFALPFERIPSVEFLSISLRPSLFLAGLVILRAVYLLARRRLKFNLLSPQKILLFFLVWIVLLIPEAINIKRAAAVVVFNGFTIATAFAVSLLFKREYIKSLLSSLFVSASLVTVFGIYQYPADLLGVPAKYTGLLERYQWKIFGFPRIQSTAIEPLYYASYLTLPISAAVSLLIFDTKKIFSYRLLWWLLVLFSFGLFLTVSRGGALALAVVLVVTSGLSILLRRFDWKKVIKVVVALIISFGVAYGTISLFNDTSLGSSKEKRGDTYTKHIQDTGLEGGGDERALSRQKALQVLKDNRIAWLIGIGPGQYGPYIQNNQEKDDGGWFIVNNLTLELLVEGGLIGLFTVVIFFATLLWKLFVLTKNSKDNNILIFTVTIVAFLAAEAAQYQTFSTLYIVQIWVVTGFGLGMILINKKRLLK